MGKVTLKKPKKDSRNLKGIVKSLLSGSKNKVKVIEKEQRAKAKEPKVDPNLTKLQSEVELMNAKLMATQEMVKGHTETIMFVSEHVGEFKTYMVDIEKNLNKLLVQVNRNSMRLDNIRPVGAQKMFAKHNMKIEEFDAKLEGYKDIQVQLKDQIKEVKSKLNQIKNIEPLLELNKEMSEKVVELHKLSALVDRHSSKSEQIYTEMQGHVRKMDVIKKEFDDIQDGFRDNLKDVDKLRLRVEKVEKK